MAVQVIRVCMRDLGVATVVVCLCCYVLLRSMDSRGQGDAACRIDRNLLTVLRACLACPLAQHGVLSA